MNKLEVNPIVKALIFDCDGTLVDSMPLHMKAWEHALERFNLTFDYEFFFSRKGMSELEIINEYLLKVDSDINGSDVVKEKHSYFRNHLNDVKPITEVVDIVLENKNKLPMAVVSGGTRENVIESIKVIGIENYFKVIITSDDKLKPKPAPDKFYEAAKIMKVDPIYCQVFEDGDPGITAAKSAGMFVTDVREFLQD